MRQYDIEPMMRVGTKSCPSDRSKLSICYRRSLKESVNKWEVGVVQRSPYWLRCLMWSVMCDIHGSRGFRQSRMNMPGQFVIIFCKQNTHGTSLERARLRYDSGSGSLSNATSESHVVLIKMFMSELPIHLRVPDDQEGCHNVVVCPRS